MRRLIVQMLTVVALAAMALLVSSGTASAQITAGAPAQFLPGTDCLHPPDPASPSSGVSAWIDQGPATIPTGDPFAANATVTIYDVYGYAGSKIHLYDEGCDSANPLSGFQIWNDLANFTQGLSSALIAVAVTLYRTVFNPAFAAIFDPIQKAASQILGGGIFLPFIALSVAGAAVYLLLRNRAGDVRGAAETAAKTMTAVAVGVLCITYPLMIGPAVDKGVGTVMTALADVASPDAAKEPGDALGGAAVAAVTYATWKQATFGTGELNQQVASEYGPKLFANAAFTRTEQAAIDKNPGLAKELADKKREAYKAAAKVIQDKYPQVYEYVAGNKQQEQFGFAVAGLVGALIAMSFLIYALFQIAYGLVMVRVGIGVGPAVAFASAYPPLYQVLPATLTVVAKALLRAVYFGAAATVFLVAAVGSVLSPTTTLHPLLKIFALLVLTYALIRGGKMLGIELRHRKEQPTRPGRYAGFNQSYRMPPLNNVGTSRPDPVDVGFMPASRTGGAPGAPHPGGRVPMPAVAAAGRTATSSAIGAGRGAVTGARSGIAKAAVFTASTGGVGGVGAAAAVAGASIKGAAMGAAKGAASGAVRGRSGSGFVAGAISATAAPAKAATKGAGVATHTATAATGGQQSSRARAATAVFHPGQPGTYQGPIGPADSGRVVQGKRVYTLYQAGTGVAK